MADLFATGVLWIGGALAAVFVVWAVLWGAELVCDLVDRHCGVGRHDREINAFDWHLDPPTNRMRRQTPAGYEYRDATIDD